jgi:Mn2+/Fe2+ NRAMP family transporter
MIIANNKQLMGEHRNRWLANTLGWATVALMAAATIAFFATGAGM